jgi:hypothetical protein
MAFSERSVSNLGTGLVCGALLEWAHIGLRTFCDMKRSSTLTGPLV